MGAQQGQWPMREAAGIRGSGEETHTSPLAFHIIYCCVWWQYNTAVGEGDTVLYSNIVSVIQWVFLMSFKKTVAILYETGMVSDIIAGWSDSVLLIQQVNWKKKKIIQFK